MVDVTNPELDALEDVLVSWNLCSGHLNRVVGADPEQIAAWQYGCKKCLRVHRALVDRSLKLWSKLCRAYDRK